ncbi:sigma-54-dependent transcriptional regulator [Arcticibacter sp. MXS-1]|uniref:sigma-54-dependent transcriptional regulator n=1 Tax=Arcticibacter sp. MXS-1 TaxID=3341726 RepID=UPI0035A85CCD
MILIIDDDVAVRTSLSLLLGREGFKTISAASEAEAVAALEKNEVLLVIMDLNFSRDTSGREGMLLLTAVRQLNPQVPVILITGWATIDLAVQGMKLGANDFVSKPWNNEQLLQSVHTLLRLQHKRSGSVSRRQLDKQYDFKKIVGEDPQMLELLATIGHVAATDASVLITGESGTGKELIAEALHENSLRSKRPFVKVNLGGISGSLFESEMFGHVRGAYTDARQDRIGRFELANKGTIFLDEIGELDPASQVKLLRVLQDRTFEVLGSSRTKTADVRVVCATNRNLEEMVSAGSFREDLLYRINLITLRIPALRERPKDIPLLVNAFVENLKELYRKPALQVSRQALEWLQKQSFPGNIRQLKNLVERTVLISRHELLDVKDFQKQYDSSLAKKGTVQLPDVGSLTLEELEIMMIRKAMEFHRNRVSRAAASLGITRNALYRRLEKYNIPYDEAEN